MMHDGPLAPFLPPRDGQAGMTLIEVMVVLVIVAVMAGGIGLSLGSLQGDSALQRETELLTQRIDAATALALASGAATALIWHTDGYALEIRRNGAWQPFDDPALAGPHRLGGGLAVAPEPAGTSSGESARRLVIYPTMMPPDDTPVVIKLRDSSGERVLVFDGWQLRPAVPS